MQGTDADVVIATHHAFSAYLAEYGRDDYLKIGQEHTVFAAHEGEVREDLIRHYARLDALVTVSEEDARSTRAKLKLGSTVITCIPNGIPPVSISPSRQDRKIVMAAGRLVEIKRFDLAVKAFERILPEFPDWTFRLYGRGPERQKLKEYIDRQSLSENVLLMGPSNSMASEWVKASIAFSSCRDEAFGIMIIEAMRAGVPVVSAHAPYGPKEIIRQRLDGIIIDDDDEDEVAALAGALRELMADPVRRAHMGAAAVSRSLDFSAQRAASRYMELFGSLMSHRVGGGEADVGVVEADCRVMEDGTLQFLLPPSTRPGRRSLVLAKEDGTRRAFPVDESAGPTAHIAPSESFPAGDWSVFLAQGGGMDGDLGRPLVGREIDQRVPGPHEAFLIPGGKVAALLRFPYLAAEGRGLMVRNVQLAHHAEVRSRVADGTHMTFRVELFGMDLSSVRSVWARSRNREESQLDFEVEAKTQDDGQVRFDVPFETLTQRRSSAAADIWDLFLTRDDEQRPVRIGKMDTQALNIGAVHNYPVSFFEDTPHGRVRCRSYFTAGGKLTLNTVDLDSRAT